MKNFNHEVIFCIVNAGFSDAVMDAAKEFGAGGGTGLTVSPVGFLIVDPTGAVDFINVTQKACAPEPIEQIADLVERVPDVIERIKDLFTTDSRNDLDENF